MPSEPDTSALQRFARDLRRIRKDREVPLTTVHAATQVPTSQLQSFEAGTLYEQSSLNPVYLRGFVRTYAEAIGLPPDPVLDHLDSALSGEYENHLAVQYLDVPPSVVEPDPSPEPSDASPSEANEDESQRPSSVGEGEDVGENAPPIPAGSEESSEQPDRSEVSPPKQESSRSLEVAYFGNESDLWTKHRATLFVALTSLIVLGIVGVLVSTYLGGASSPPESPAEPTSRAAESADHPSPDSQVTTDSAKADEPPRPRADVTLGDTLHVTVLATADVREMRVQQDDDLRRPYWIREGEARVFPFARRITLQNQLDSLRLLLERYPYPVSRTDDEGRIVITRDKARQFFDTLRTPRSTVSVTPDTVWGGAPTSEAESSLRPPPWHSADGKIVAGTRLAQDPPRPCVHSVILGTPVVGSFPRTTGICTSHR